MQLILLGSLMLCYFRWEICVTDGEPNTFGQRHACNNPCNTYMQSSLNEHGIKCIVSYFKQCGLIEGVD